ncbi:nitroreductase family protein [Streptococcus sp. zg-JUN1979]|uniref:nitroreductase family protein n=1 Tax=Streptococcus sp. zg-JUN1979 TaxID=3391450 RepID=UPI0039A73D30
MSVIKALQNRRSIYALSSKVDVADEVLVDTISEAVTQSPSAFNSQSSRIVILLNDEVEAFWNGLVADELLKTMDASGAPEEAKEATKAKLAGFAKSKGVVLFFEDQDVVKGLQEQFPLYAENFPVWSEQSTGIASVNTWTVLSHDLGLGANLQHYNPVIDEAVMARYDVPAHWKLRGQLNFGAIEAPAASKEVIDVKERVKVFK